MTEETKATDEITEEMPQPAEEGVLAVPTPELWGVVPQRDGHQGVVASGLADLLEVVDLHGVFLPRSSADQDERYKQIIPYTLLVLLDPLGEFANLRVATYRRTKLNGEQRLSGLRSCGFGGHVSQEDDPSEGQSLSQAIPTSAGRELHEELGGIAVGAHGFHLLGFINDDSTPVGRVHFGLVHAVVHPDPVNLSSSDPAIGDLRWQFLPEIRLEQKRNPEDWEPWSRMAIQLLTELRPEFHER